MTEPVKLYSPPHYDEQDVAVIHGLIRAHPFATLVLTAGGHALATHVPVLLRSTATPSGMLAGHVARANPVWTEVAAGSEALAIFHGANHYISPRWYPSRGEQGKALPTWDYSVVHARGPIEWIADRVWLQALLEEMLDTFERGSTDPWRIAEMSAASRAGLLGGIMGFQVPIESLQGKRKLNQKSPAEDRAAIASALQAIGSAAAASMAEEIGGAGKPTANG